MLDNTLLFSSVMFGIHIITTLHCDNYVGKGTVSRTGLYKPFESQRIYELKLMMHLSATAERGRIGHPVSSYSIDILFDFFD